MRFRRTPPRPLSLADQLHRLLVTVLLPLGVIIALLVSFVFSYSSQYTAIPADSSQPGTGTLPTFSRARADKRIKRPSLLFYATIAQMSPLRKSFHNTLL